MHGLPGFRRCRKLFLISLPAGLLLTGCDKPADAVEQTDNPSTPAKPKTSTSTPGSSRTGDKGVSSAASATPSNITADEALRQVGALTDAEQRATLAGQLIATMSASQLDALTRNLVGQPASPARDALLKAALAKMAEKHPQDAMALALQLEPDGSARALAREVAKVWAKSDYRAAYDFAATLPRGETRDEIEAAAVRAWSDKDPMEAFRYLANLRFNEGGTMIGIAARRLSLRNSEEAFQALDLVQDPRVWDTAAGRIFEALAQQDRKAATDILFQQDDIKVASPLAYALGSVYANTSVEEGIGVLNEIGDPQAANMFIHGIIHTLRSKDMEGLMANIPLIENTSFQQIAAESTARELVQRNPSRATEWINTLENADSRARAYQGTGMGYAAKDPNAAEQWLETLPAGKDRRYAIFGYAMQNMQANPGNSASWALQIAEPEVRERLLRMVLSSWNRSDTSAARAWAGSTGYTNLLPSR